MALVVVERLLDADATGVDARDRKGDLSWCLATHGVRLLRTFRACDMQHSVSLYEAPDAEAVRVMQRAAGEPVQHVWTATPIIDRPADMPRGFSLVVAQRALPEETTLEHVQYLATDPLGCGKRLRLVQIGGFLALDCSRMCCVYYTQDLESVRVGNREAGIPIERLWKAESLDAAL
jgi:hypothetical protein